MRHRYAFSPEIEAYSYVYFDSQNKWHFIKFSYLLKEFVDAEINIQSEVFEYYDADYIISTTSDFLLSAYFPAI